MRKKIIILSGVILLISGWSLCLRAAEETGSVHPLKDAMKMYKNGQRAEAVEKIKQLIKERPESENAMAHLHLGFIYFRLKQPDHALDEFSKCIALKDGSPMAYYFTALIYEANAKAARRMNAADEESYEKKAMDAWQHFLITVDPSKSKFEHQPHNGLSVKESIERAKKHVSRLEEDLRNEKK